MPKNPSKLNEKNTKNSRSLGLFFGEFDIKCIICYRHFSFGITLNSTNQ